MRRVVTILLLTTAPASAQMISYTGPSFDYVGSPYCLQGDLALTATTAWLYGEEGKQLKSGILCFKLVNAQDDPAYKAGIAPLLDKEKQLEDRVKQLEDSQKVYADKLDALAATPHSKADRPTAHRHE